jgi:hypothetical protein
MVESLVRHTYIVLSMAALEESIAKDIKENINNNLRI